MGAGLSVELGADSLYEDNLRELEEHLNLVKDQNRELQELDLSNRFLGVRGAQVAAEPLARTKVLKSLNVSYNGLGGPARKRKGRPRPPDDMGITYLMDALVRNHTLTKLNLAGNALAVEGTRSVQRMLQHNATLQHLILFNNDICDTGVSALCEALAHNTNLSRLNLDYNDIGDAGAENLWTVFETNTSLVELSLRDNDGVSERWLKELDVVLARNRGLQEEVRLEQEAKDGAERQAREAEEADRKEREEKREEERQRIEAEYAAIEAKRKAEEDERRSIQEAAQRARQQARMEKEADREAHEEHLQNLVNLAYAWRDTLRGGERRGREWRSGFTTFKDTDYGMRDTFQPPSGLETSKHRRLEACWCEPPDQTVLFAGQLHYHCVHEPNDTQLLEDGKPRKYEGCRLSSHRCRTAPISHKAADRGPSQLFGATQVSVDTYD